MSPLYPIGGDCSWCGLRRTKTTVHATPTCPECEQGGRKFRVTAYLQRLKRAAGDKR